MYVIEKIVLTDVCREPSMDAMFTTAPTRVQAPQPTPNTIDNPWLLWRPEVPQRPDVLSVAEMAECLCPDLCNRDHANE